MLRGVFHDPPFARSGFLDELLDQNADFRRLMEQRRQEAQMGKASTLDVVRRPRNGQRMTGRSCRLARASREIETKSSYDSCSPTTSLRSESAPTKKPDATQSLMRRTRNGRSRAG